jgi:hypothetical protein
VQFLARCWGGGQVILGDREGGVELIFQIKKRVREEKA